MWPKPAGQANRQLGERTSKSSPRTTVMERPIGRSQNELRYSVRKLTVNPVNRSSNTIDAALAEYFTWLLGSSNAVLRLNIVENKYNVCCFCGF